MCGVSYDHRVTLHDHIFTTGHINRIKKLLQTDNIQTEGPIDLNAVPETFDKEDIQRTRFQFNFSDSTTFLFQLGVKSSVFFQVFTLCLILLFKCLIITIFRMKAIRDRRTIKSVGVSALNSGSNTMPHFPYNFLYSIRSGQYKY